LRENKKKSSAADRDAKGIGFIFAAYLLCEKTKRKKLLEPIGVYQKVAEGKDIE